MTTEQDKAFDEALEAYADPLSHEEVSKLLGWDKITFGQSLRSFRKCEEWTLEQTAQKLGVSKQLLSAYERGKQLPSLAKVVEMADVFGTDPSVWVHYRVQDEMRLIGFESTIQINLHRIA